MSYNIVAYAPCGASEKTIISTDSCTRILYKYFANILITPKFSGTVLNS